MRLNMVRVLGSLLVVALFSPLGLLAAIEPSSLPYLTSPSANWADTEDASHVFNHIEHLAQKVRKEDGPLTIESEAILLSWHIDADKLVTIRHQVNEMSSDLVQLSEMRAKLEPWQQQLVKSMTPRVHDLVYETEAAIKMLNGQHSMMALAGTSYPQYLDAISHDAHKLAGSVGTYTQYAQAAQKMAMLQRKSSAKAS